MNKKILIAALSCGLFLVSLDIKAYAYDDGDFQIWNTDIEEVKINQDLKITLEEEFRWGDNASDFYYQHYDLGLSFSLNKNLNFGTGYRHVLEKKSVRKVTKFRVENAPYLTLTLSWNLAGFKFDDRSRLEYRHFNYQSDSGRYRNKLTMKLPWKFTRIKIQPFVADEILAGFGGISRFNQNRFSSGLGMSLAKNAKAEIYYMLLNTRSSRRWPSTNVLGAKIKISF